MDSIQEYLMSLDFREQAICFKRDRQRRSGSALATFDLWENYCRAILQPEVKTIVVSTDITSSDRLLECMRDFVLSKEQG